MENDFRILRLTKAFYDTYPNPPYVEILAKQERPYNCILFKHHDYFICVPYRTEISHKYAYHFKNSARSANYKSGLDYTKIVIIVDTRYIDDKNAIIDKDEYNETSINISRIKRETLKFVEDYVSHIKGENILHPIEFKRRYGYSPLKYFHFELGLQVEK